MKKQNKKSIAVDLSHIRKEYLIHHEKPTLVEKFVKAPKELFIALNNIDLTIYEGERVGILGRNGCGKTTLLKVISGITTPTRGKRDITGKIISLIDLEAGFHLDLTGEQNIYINGMLLGMKRNDIEKKQDAIIAYADLRQFIDAPLYTYSQGMKLRLGLAIAIHSDPDILVLDEGLGVGDENFRKKVMQTLQTEFHKKTIIIATHNLEVIGKQCKRILIMNQGSIIHDGGLALLPYYEKRFI